MCGTCPLARQRGQRPRAAESPHGRRSLLLHNHEYACKATSRSSAHVLTLPTQLSRPTPPITMPPSRPAAAAATAPPGLTALQEIFPDSSLELLSAALQVHSGDLAAAAACVLEGVQEERPASTPSAAGAPGPRASTSVSVAGSSNQHAASSSPLGTRRMPDIQVRPVWPPDLQAKRGARLETVCNSALGVGQRLHVACCIL